jgi:hypothetical protein
MPAGQLSGRRAAQAFDLRMGTGNEQPGVFDFDGDHHACVYGYYGQSAPPFPIQARLFSWRVDKISSSGQDSVPCWSCNSALS